MVVAVVAFDYNQSNVTTVNIGILWEMQHRCDKCDTEVFQRGAKGGKGGLPIQ